MYKISEGRLLYHLWYGIVGIGYPKPRRRLLLATIFIVDDDSVVPVSISIQPVEGVELRLVTPLIGTLTVLRQASRILLFRPYRQSALPI